MGQPLVSLEKMKKWKKQLSAFLLALAIGCYGHYYKIVKNGIAGYPDEWFPSVSATTGDWYPERNICQIFIALTSGPRLLLCYLWYLLTVRNVPANGSKEPQSLRYRKFFAYSFFGALIPMVHFFIQHNVHRIPGAYTYYAFFEWSLIISDLAFDAVCLIDFQTFELRIVDVGLNGKQEDSAKALNASTFRSHFLCRDVYLGFVFWSMLTALPLMIWYFPLWHMGISGYEAFLFCNLISVLLGINFLRRGIERAKGFVSDPAHRLMAVAAGSLLSLVAWAATLFGQRHQNGRAERGVLTLALGLILHNVVKMAWWANNPIWPIMNENTGGQNMIGFALGLLASIQNWLLAALGSGGYLFCLHSMFTDSTTISRWSLGGYPNTGPQPVPGGMMVIAAMAAGLTLSSKRRWVTSLIWWAIGAAGLAVLHFNEGDIGFAGGIVFTVYALSLFPSIVHSLTRQPPGRTFFVGMLVYNILALAHVWVVAYAFVPGGEVLRERTDYVLIAMQTCILLGVFNSNSSAWDVPLETHARSPFSVARLYSKLTLVGLVLASVGICYKRLPKSSPQPYHPEHKLITAGIWTIHFAIDNDMYNSEIRMRDVIRDLELDVIGLLESDLQRIIMGNRDLTQFLAEDLNMYADYGPGPTKHTWGCSMLSKFPIKQVDVIVSHNGQEEDLLDRQLQTTELGRIMRQGQEIYELLMDGGHVHDIEVSDWDRWCQYLAFRGVKRVGYARVSHGGITDTEIQVGKYTLLEDHPTSWDKSQSIEEFRKEETYVKIPEDQVPEGLRFPSMFYGAGIRNTVSTSLIVLTTMHKAIFLSLDRWVISLLPL
ncbi:hypothetical protein BCR41DRAFT_379067 [Lobosporangium transversale]|uniref:Frag1/DRAM/Sfk1 family-domain-containing protein n=1 Tax=Lobosporangium transversale TaxID=64571 RepID=A0A1Y2G950_9FUNG|nr:hypothetical protein BCR41DRAFT_379067 [Lobosporangium transversale]ORZ04605.1 hypothetical protein BCR41DRAFT_379067 [Lobosporangium transversale]|eukprot:XP_021876651.1 hypothetical protein BCR41DRAFT_379067 [Lobosporangium transversale]